MKVSIIVPTYKDPVALGLILEALEKQTYKNFEVIIAEDDNSPELATYIDNLKMPYPVQHVSQEDKGWRKAKALNQAIQIAEGDYLIFFDGDCLPYSTFVENHVLLSEGNRVLCGRRVNLGDGVSLALRNKTETVADIEKNFLKKLTALKNDGARHIEQGLDILSILPKALFEVLGRKTRLVGCNFSVYKSKMVEINGFDEEYPTGDIADDVDVEWRLNAIGVMNKSCKYAANLLHLNHSRSERKVQHDKNYVLMVEKQKKNQIRCSSGIERL
ncbi:MAG: glycosyltransferase [Sulfuricurvum sp.]|nr:glycosyltransferase [Sulfuricurvum sp.]